MSASGGLQGSTQDHALCPTALAVACDLRPMQNHHMSFVSQQYCLGMFSHCWPSQCSGVCRLDMAERIRISSRTPPRNPLDAAKSEAATLDVSRSFRFARSTSSWGLVDSPEGFAGVHTPLQC